MNVLLVNDTRIESNPGCHATVNELLNFLNENLTIEITESLKLGEEYSIFSENFLNENSKFSFKKLVNLISRKLIKKEIYNTKPTFDFRLWKKKSFNNISKPTQDKIRNADLIVVNMEGTIHHNNIGSLALLGIANYSKKQLNKKVILVNGTYQKMNEIFAKKVLNKMDFISVREIKSMKYLKKQNIDSYLIPDFAFRAFINSNDSIIDKIELIKTNKDDKKCLYTAGVLGVYPEQVNGLNLKIIKKHINDIKALGYKPYYLKIEEKEKHIVNELNKQGVIVISNNDGITYKNIGTVLNNFDLIITGRYHIGIFGLMNRLPTYFIKSNTFKIEGLLEMLGLRDNMIIDNKINNIRNKLGNALKYQLPDESDYREFKNFLLKLESCH